MRELATKIKAKVKASGQKNPWVSPDLRKFLPTYCPEFEKVNLEGGFLAVYADSPDKSKSERRLEVATWCLAWDNYALAAVVLKQVSLLCGCVQAVCMSAVFFVQVVVHSSAEA